MEKLCLTKPRFAQAKLQLVHNFVQIRISYNITILSVDLINSFLPSFISIHSYFEVEIWRIIFPKQSPMIIPDWTITDMNVRCRHYDGEMVGNRDTGTYVAVMSRNRTEIAPRRYFRLSAKFMKTSTRSRQLNFNFLRISENKI